MWFWQKKEIEVARVRVNKLRHWVYLQFRPYLERINNQLATNMEHSIAHTETVIKKIKQLESVSTKEFKIHVSTLLVDHRNAYVKSMKELLAQIPNTVPDSIQEKAKAYDEIEHTLQEYITVKKKVEPSLGKHLQKAFDAVEQEMGAIKENVNAAREILQQKEYQLYLSMDTYVDHYLGKITQIEKLHQEMAELNKHRQVLQKRIDDYEQKVGRLQSDPKLAIEKEIKYTSKFKHSFYELELDDMKQKLKQLHQNRDSLDKKRSAIDNAIADIDPQKEILSLNKKLRSRFFIEVDLIGHNQSAPKA